MSKLMDKSPVGINKIIRPMLDNKKIQFNDLQGTLKRVTEEVKDATGFNARWKREEESFYNGEITLRVKNNVICTYCIKYNVEQNLFIATEVL
ncbi:hypothetical protein [Listeria booriae]|uniref:hypothetical protein n=1 Tax=Listeria booriae TaxID=1552123 RepID=UPI001623ACCF|nr:hypothetical protein [Listeria booriae]MBC1983460.1 hypothetical protein [Listeria booriae]